MCECGLWRPKSLNLTSCYMNIPSCREMIWFALKVYKMGLFEIIHQIYIFCLIWSQNVLKRQEIFFFVVSTTWLIKYQHLYFHEPACLNWNILLWHLTVSYRMGKLLALWYTRTWVCFRNLLNDLHSHWHTADCCLCGELMTDTQLDFFCQNWAFQ